MNVGNGKLGKNPRKTHEKQPDYLGSILVRGEIITLVGWKRTARETGESFLYLVANSEEVANSKEEEFLQAFGGTLVLESDSRKVAMVQKSILEGKHETRKTKEGR